MALISTALLPATLAPTASHAALTFTISGTWDTQARKDAATAAMQAVVNRYNAYGNFTLNNSGNINVIYEPSVATADATYNGTIRFGGTYPNERVSQHESNHWLGSGTTSNSNNNYTNGQWNGPKMNALVAQFDGDGTVIHQSGVHFYGYGLNYDSEVVNGSVLNRNIALMYAQRQDDGLGTQANPWSATTVTMTASDAVGASSFNWSNTWNDTYFAHAGAAYSTGNFTIRTPLDTYTPSAATPSFTFAGDSLTVNNTNGLIGGLLYKGVGTTGLLTFKNLILDGGYVRHASGAGDLFQIAGKVTLASTATIDAAQGSIKVLANIVGSGSVTKAGANVLTLTGNSVYTGSTTISAGILRLAPVVPIASYTFDNISGTTVVNDGSGSTAMNGTLANGAAIVGGGQTGNAVSLASGASVDINSAITDLGNNANWTVSAWVKTTTAGSSLLTKGSGTSWTTGNTIFYLGDGTGPGSGGVPSSVRYAGGFFQGSTGATAVNNNVWHQVTYVNNAGTYNIYVDGVLQPLSAGNSSFANSDIGAIVRLGITTNTVASDGTVNFNGLMDNVKFYTQALSGSQISALYQGTNIYGTLPTTTNVSIAASATLDVNGAIQQIGSLTGPSGSAVTLGTGQLTINSTANSTFAGAISGTGGSLAKNGSGTFTLSGTNTYTGGTTLTGGTLNLGSIGAIGTTGTIAFTGGTLQSSGANQIDYSARFSTAANQAYSIDTNGQTVTLAGNITSTGGTFTKLGTGTLNLTGNNACTGTTTVSAGTLTVANTAGITGSANVSVSSGATLNVLGTLKSGANLSVSGTTNIGPNIGTTTGTGQFKRTLGSLAVASGATVTLQSNTTHTGRTLLEVSSFSNAGKVNIGDADLLIHNADATTLANLVSQINAGRNTTPGGGFDGTWNGTSGLVSSAVSASFSANGIEDRSIGYMLVGDYFFGGVTSFDGVSVIGSDLLVKYTRNGDADLSGIVDDNDVSLVGAFYGDSLTNHHWYDGDFDGNGAIDDNDVAVLGTFYDLTQPALSASALTTNYGPSFAAAFEAGFANNVSSTVPEPASLGLLAIGATFYFSKRRRRA